MSGAVRSEWVTVVCGDCDWLERVLANGESVQAAPPDFARADRGRLVAILRTTFESQALHIAGPAVAFDADVAGFGAETLAVACWRLGRDEGPVSFTGREPRSPADHLSADVTLRLLPTVWRRLKSRGPDHPLIPALDAILRAWPLSGVLAGLDGHPTARLDFAGHTGLQRLYAEQLAATGTDGWIPPYGPARECAELTFAEHNRAWPEPTGASHE